MTFPQPSSDRKLNFIVSYPLSGSNWVRAIVYLLTQLAKEKPADQIDLSAIDNEMPWDVHFKLYQMATNKPAETLTEHEIAAARPRVHHLLATRFPGYPVVRSQAMRGAFYGHPTFHKPFMARAAYVVRNPLEVAAAMVRETDTPVMKAIEAMMTRNFRPRPDKEAVREPLGSWSQNVKSWTQTKDPKVLVVRFEDIASKPVQMFTRIAEHIGITVKPGVIGPLEHVLLTQQVIEGPKFDGRDYTAHLSPAQARAIIEVHALQMNRHGYLDSKVLEYASIERDVALALSERHTGDAVLN